MTRYILLFCLLGYFFANAQSTTITPGSAGSVSVPKLSYDQIMAIPNPQAGMMAFDSTFKCLKYYNGNKWLCTSQNGSDNTAVGFAWKKAVYNNGYERANAIAVDKNNNVYISGSAGNEAMYGYIAKFSPNGTLIWEYTDYYYHANRVSAIAVDDNFQVYVLLNASFRSNNLGILKLDAKGALLWRKNGFGDIGSYRYAENIFFDTNQQIYVTGRFTTNLTIDSFTINSNIGYEGFVVKLSNDGTVQWLKSTNSGLVSKVASNGESYFAGHFTGSITIAGNTLNSTGNEDIVIGKLNKDGSLAWVKRAGGIGTDKANTIAVDNAGDVYIAGSFSGNAYFDTTPVNAVDAEDFYLVKYRSDGLFLWLRNGGGAGTDSGIKIELSSAGQPIVLGSASSNSLTFYPGFVLSPPVSPGNFLIRYDAFNGNITWARVVENASDFKVNPQDEIYTWQNIAVGMADPGNSKGYQNILTKYLYDGTFAYRLINGGALQNMAFGTNKHFFFIGNYSDTIQVGASTLTSTDNQGDMYISHWME
ncbi:SBBP repeat-containing protein [Emticicia sp. C21]|uniref:SBBP repeat-containing protein n=1 Tax=Emticicia sp. C21 TaxID=2302915 RepID=UPI000E354669|nr:SBBP repeat-containing protein [Emticicia sp. C21]RFS17041.1 hypothetical protein D0T08_10215 [Emticicia sp. C21]